LIYEKVKKYGCKIISEPENLDFTDYYYRCFYFEDTEGNLIEIAKYER
jgi:predicted enzyme related to lactoylglutathione lyase